MGIQIAYIKFTWISGKISSFVLLTKKLQTFSSETDLLLHIVYTPFLAGTYYLWTEVIKKKSKLNLVVIFSSKECDIKANDLESA